MTNALTRFEPVNDVLRLSDAMEQLLNESWVLPRSFFGSWNGASRMPLDLYETDDTYVIKAFMPGVPSDKLDIQVQQNVLSIHGEASAEQPEGAHYLIQERGSGVFDRSVRLPTAVDAEKIAASLSDGVLTITVPKAEHVKPRRISIKTA
jgi:HSP20 family protein